MDPLAIFIFIFGAMVGSFLNVCIVRLPQSKSIVFPSSHCVSCQKPIAWIDNVPLLSWVLLGGKCRSCKAPISFRYWLVELITALGFLGFYLYFGFTPLLGVYLVMLSCFIVATFVDFKERIIPDEVSVGGLFVGIFLSAIVPQMHPVNLSNVYLSSFLAGLIVVLCIALMSIYPFFCKHLMDPKEDPQADRGIKILVLSSLFAIALINWGLHYMPVAWAPYALSISASLSGYLIGGGIIYAMGLIGDIIFRKESMGGGDVKLMALVGAFLGWEMAVLAFFIAPFFGVVYGVVEKIRTKDSAIAYGPFLVLASLVSLFWGERIIRWVITGGMSF